MKEHTEDKKTVLWTTVGQLVAVVLTITLFLFSIDMLGASFAHMGTGFTGLVMSAVENPFISLFIGILLTAILQSSSTTTAMVVAFVASGMLNFSSAIPMVMGANIGTTLTNLLVALGFIARKGQFRKAFATGSLHGIYNILLVLILFPLEYRYHSLSKLAIKIATVLPDAKPSTANDLLAVENYLVDSISTAIISLFDNSFVPLIFSVLLLFGSIKLMSKVSSSILSRGQRKYYQLVFDNTLKSFSWGVLLTGALQSSTMTTTLLVPMVATKKVKLQDAFPFIVGANVGTTVTALLAALFKSDAAISIAIVHLLFNLTGMFIFLPFSVIRNSAIRLATEMGYLAQKYRMSGFIYIIVVFFLMPFTLIYVNKESVKEEKLKQQEVHQSPEKSGHLQPERTLHPTA